MMDCVNFCIRTVGGRTLDITLNIDDNTTVYDLLVAIQEYVTEIGLPYTDVPEKYRLIFCGNVYENYILLKSIVNFNNSATEPFLSERYIEIPYTRPL